MSGRGNAQKQRRRRADRARRAAFDALRTVNSEGAYANLVLPALLRERGLARRDAGFATELVAGTCRWQGSYDMIIAAAAGRPLGEFQPAVLDLLRLGVHQILSMRVPAPAAVAASVDLAAVTVGERVTGIVNAVLRRVADRSLNDWFDQLSRGLDDHGQLALRTAHPRWIVEAYSALLQPEELAEALNADNLSPRVCLAVRPGLADLSDLEVELMIQERDVSQIFVGQRCRVQAEAYMDRVYDGVVSRLMPIADRAKGAVPVRVKILVPAEEEGVYLKPEMGAIVTFLNQRVSPTAATAQKPTAAPTTAEAETVPVSTSP